MMTSRPLRVIRFEQGKALVEYNERRMVVNSDIELATGDFVLCDGERVVRRLSSERAKQIIEDTKDISRLV